MVEAGEFNNLASATAGFILSKPSIPIRHHENLFLREQDKNGNDNIVFAKEGNFSLTDNKRTLELRDGYRYSGTPGKADYNRVSFQHLSHDYQHHAQTHRPVSHRRTIPTSQLIGSSNPQHQAELMWRISLTVSVLLLCLLAVAAFLFQSAQRPYLQYLDCHRFVLVYQTG